MQLAKATQHTHRHAEWVNEWVCEWVSERKREREWVRVKHALNEISLQLIWQSWCTRRCQNVIPEWQCQVGSQSTPPRQISALYSMCVRVCANVQSQREIKRNEVDHVSILHQSQTQSQSLPYPLSLHPLSIAVFYTLSFPRTVMALHLLSSVAKPQLLLLLLDLLWLWPHALLIQFESNVNNQVPRMDH